HAGTVRAPLNAFLVEPRARPSRCRPRRRSGLGAGPSNNNPRPPPNGPGGPDTGPDRSDRLAVLENSRRLERTGPLPLRRAVSAITLGPGGSGPARRRDFRSRLPRNDQALHRADPRRRARWLTLYEKVCVQD